MTLAAVDLANLLYLAGALAAATIVSAVYLLRHRRPRSMEAGINEFSRELRALAPDAEAQRRAASTSTSTPTPVEPSRRVARGERAPAGAPAGRSSGASAGRGERARGTRARGRARQTGDGQTG